MSEAALAGVIRTDEPEFESGSDKPFLLEGGGGWFVREGRLDVFSVPLSEGTVSGCRTHLFRVEPGRIALAVRGNDRATPALGLLAVGATGTRLVRVPHEMLRQLAADPEQAEQLATLLDDWVELLCASIARDVEPKDCAELESGDYAPPPTVQRVRSGQRIAWIRHEEGKSLLLGRPDLVVNGGTYTPLSQRAWLELGTGAKLKVEPTRGLLGKDDLWSGLGHLHDLVLDCATQLSAQAVASERERLRQKAAADRRAFSGAVSRLADTLDGGKPGARSGSHKAIAGATGAIEDPLFTAVQMVGTAAGIQMRPAPRESGASMRRDPLATIAQTSRVRTRLVMLRDGWWRTDAGPFLAYLEADQRPVALIPTPRTGYMLHDPVAHTEERVTAAVAMRLDPRGYSFYRPFADAAIGIKDLVVFGLHGCTRDVTTVILMCIATGLLTLLTPIATGLVFNDIIPGADRPQLLQLTLGLIVIAIATAVFGIANSIALVRIEGKMTASMQSAVWDRLLSLPLPFFRPYSAGDLATRAMGIDAIRQMLSGATVTALLGAFVSLFHFGLLFHYNVKLGAWATLLIAIAVGAAAVCSRLQMRQERAVAGIRVKLAGTILQFLSSVGKLRIAGAEVRAFAIWARQFSDQRQRQYNARTIGNAYGAFIAAFPITASLILYALAMPILADGKTLRTGDFLAFMSSFGTCLAGMLSAAMALLGTLSVVPLYEQAKPILVTRPEVDQGKSDPGTLSGDIELQRLRFRYHSNGALVLRDITLQIRSGEFVAFVGPSGSGKSTILRLLLGFEVPEAGGIFYDGQDLAGLDCQAVRRQIGVVLQSGRVMSGDLFTNIVGASLATIDDAWEAASMAGFDQDIRNMPMGMHTVVSEGGGTLSGGQRQRLMISRALVQKPRILLFDEATSALDNRTQDIVTASLEHLKATRVLVAHRLSTIIRAHRIYVVDGGRIVESGNYETLMAARGMFSELARRQLA